LHSFLGSDGAFPSSGVIMCHNGNLCGTTRKGGTGCRLDTSGCGTVFKLSPEKSFTIRHMFKDREGAAPYGGLIADNEGNLYGTTAAGGGQGCTQFYGCGTVFRLSPHWKYTILHAFAGSPTDGGGPGAGLIADGKGNVYGTTTYGGTADHGTIYSLTVMNP
jgi:uncharacterized repeat protein (TIGR03803 family)